MPDARDRETGIDVRWMGVSIVDWRTVPPRGSTPSSIACARQLLVVIWHVLTERAADHHADPDMVAFKLMTWSWKLTDEQRGGLTTRQFVRYQLLRLGLGHNLTHVIRGGGKYLIAPTDEVLKLKPDLPAAP